MQIPKGLLVAGGIGALAVGGFMLFKGHGDKAGADPASKDLAPAGGGGRDKAGPTAGTPTGTMPEGNGSLIPGAGTVPGAAGQAGAGGADAGGAQQVGPYTIIPDPASGAKVVFETATKQPVGVLDAQGNLLPVTVDAQGNISVDPNAAASSGAGITSPTPGVDPRAGSTTSSPMGPATGTTTGIGAPAGQAAESAQYRQIAESLFANAGDGSAGSAASSAMTGASTLGATTPTGTTTTSTTVPGAATSGYGASTAGYGASTSTGTTTGASALSSIPGAQQVGNYTVVPDPQSGANLVFDTASQQPVGVLDAQGNLVPIESLTGGATAGAATGASSLAPSPYGSTAPAATGSAPVGAGAPAIGAGY
jgi:hypothetical protein